MLYVNERAFATFGIPSGSERNGILSVWVDPADRLALTEEVMRAGFVDAREVHRVAATAHCSGASCRQGA